MMEQIKQLKDRYKEPIVRNSKRHIVPLVAVIAGLFALFMSGNGLWSDNFKHTVYTGLPEAGIKLSLFLLFIHFSFPKFSIQDEIKKGNIAAAILAGLIFVGVAILF